MVSVAWTLPEWQEPAAQMLPAVLAAPEPAEIILRVSGAKPVRTRGTLIVEANSWAPSTPAWHEVALYRTTDEECALSVRLLKKAPGETDVYQAEIFVSIDEALQWLEAFDPSGDLTPDFDASDRSISTTEIALRAAALRQQVDAVARQWRGLLGDLLYRFAQPG